MKTITIRECAVRALAKKTGGDTLLLAMCEQAMDGAEDIDWDGESFKYTSTSGLEPLYAALAPDILSSVREEPEPSNLLSQALSATHKPIVYRDAAAAKE